MDISLSSPNSLQFELKLLCEDQESLMNKVLFRVRHQGGNKVKLLPSSASQWLALVEEEAVVTSFPHQSSTQSYCSFY